MGNERRSEEDGSRRSICPPPAVPAWGCGQMNKEVYSQECTEWSKEWSMVRVTESAEWRVGSRVEWERFSRRLDHSETPQAQ